MSDTDSFIDEVNEELRRDKLFHLFRKYGWIVVALVVLVVGAASYVEWQKVRQKAAAEALGDSVILALGAASPSDRAQQLAAISTDNAQAQYYLELLKSASQTEAGDRTAALRLLDAVAADADAPQVYRQLAELKAVIMRGADQDRATRMATLERLAIAGAPFRVQAMEQQALAKFEFGDKDGALVILKNILNEPGATQGLIQRAQQLIVALGGELSTGADAATE